MKNNVVENIINKVPIVDEISAYVTLTKKGQNNIGICPFHDDNNPSFTVNEQKKIFKCFVCGVGGNVIKFNQMWNDYSFAQAVIDLGEKYNVDVSTYKRRNINNPLFNEEKNKLILLNNNVNEIFIQMLNENPQAQKYLDSRKLSNETIQHFKIGFKNNTLDEIAQLFEQTNVEYKVQQNSSLVTFTKDKIIDFFRNRITIPINDEFNNIVGFGSRILENNDKDVKYLNTKDTPLFKKNEILFNYYDAVKDIYDNNKQSIIVVEGYMDAISLYNQNIKNVVAVMTNNITQVQVEKLISLKKQILLCLDFDVAGMQSTFDFIHKYPDVDVKIIKLEKNLDPDEFINKYDRNTFVENITKPLSKEDFLIELDLLDLEINRNKIYNNAFQNQVEINQYSQTINEQIPPPENVMSHEHLNVDNSNIGGVKKTEVQLKTWIFEKQQKFINEEIFKDMQQTFILSYEQKELIKMEYTVFKWYINKQITKTRILEYLQILNTNILKLWIIKLIEDSESLPSIKQTITSSIIETYNERLDKNIFAIINLWNAYELKILSELNVTNDLKNDIINRSAINYLINQQRRDFFENYRNLKH